MKIIIILLRYIVYIYEENDNKHIKIKCGNFHTL